MEQDWRAGRRESRGGALVVWIESRVSIRFVRETAVFERWAGPNTPRGISDGSSDVGRRVGRNFWQTTYELPFNSKDPTSEKSGMDHVIWLHIPGGMLPTPIVLCCLEFFE